MKGNPFLATKFLWQGMPYIEKLIGDEFLNLPPVTVEIDPSNVCNHNCVWCMFDEFRFREPKKIPQKDLERVIQEIADLGCKSVVFTGGGEPLCNSEVFPESFYYVVNNGMKLGLVTNGSLLRKYAKNAFDTCKFIRFSIDSATPGTYEKTHRSKGFEEVLKTIMELVGGGVDIGLAFLVHPLNFHEVGDFCKLGHKLGVNYVQIRPAWMRGLSLSDKIIDSVTKSLEKSDHFSDEEFKIYANMERFEEIRVRNKGFNECSSTPLVGVVGADLNVYLCCQFRGFSNYSFGNLHKSSFEEIWHGERRKEIVKNINIERCPPCRYRTYNMILHDLKYCDHIDFL